MTKGLALTHAAFVVPSRASNVALLFPIPHSMPSPTPLHRPLPFHLWRSIGRKLLLQLMPLMIIGHTGLRYATDGKEPVVNLGEFVVTTLLIALLFISLGLGWDWWFERRYTWVLLPEGVKVQRHGVPVQVVPWSEITQVKLKPLGLVMWHGKNLLRYFYLPEGEAERVMAQMKERAGEIMKDE